MIFPATQCLNSSTNLRRHACLLLLVFCASVLTIPEANALDCAATFADVPGERVQLKACDSDFSNSNGDDNANFQFGGGVTVTAGDLLLVSLGVDSNGESFTPPAGWTELEPFISGRGVSSNIWTKVATAADVLKPSYQFSWLNGNEKNQGYMLLFTGTSGTYNFASGDQNAQQFPTSLAVVPNSPFNLILRTANIDRNALDTTLQGPGMAGHTDLIQQENTGNGTGSRVGITAAFTHQAAQASTGTENFSLQFAEGSHNRTISVEPYEFRFFLEDASGSSPTQSNVCSIKQVTLRVTDSGGNALPFNYVGSVSLSTSTNNGDWSDSGLNVNAVTPGGADSGTATYQFAAGDANELILNFTDTHAETVNFNVTDTATGNWQESTTAGYASPNLTINLCEFRIAYGSALDVPANTMGTCGIETITIDLVDAVNGDPATNYAGTVQIDNNRGTAGGNYTANTVPGAFNNVGNGVATYALGIGDSQVILNYTDIETGSNVNFTITEDSGLGILDSSNATFDPDLDVADCTIDIQVAPTMGVCTAGETLTITILDVDGSTATSFDGEIEISTDSVNGDYVLTSGGLGGNGTLDDGAMADDGIATYDFDVGLGDVGVVQIDFQTAVIETIQFTADETVGTPGLSVDAGSNLDLDVLGCKIVISHSTESDVCSLEAVTITIADTADNAVTGFDGTVTISSGLTNDTWTTNTVAAPGNFVDTLPNDGLFEYTFVAGGAGDNGDIVVNYELVVPTATVNFDGSSTTPGIAAPSGPDDPDLGIVACTAEISVNPQMNVCSISETVTLSILNRDSGLANGTIGSMVLTASNSKGSFISTTGVALNLNDGAPDDGIASYVFDGSEGGTVDFEYSTSTVGAFTFSSSAPNISFNSTGFENLDVLDCEFRISFDGGATGNAGTSDVCSVQAMTIQVWNVDGGSSAIVNDYVGTVNLTTTSGGWVEQGGGSPGVLDDPFPQDGSATYEFVSGDAGQVTLDFSSDSSGTLNFSVTQGAISADNASWDPDLMVSLCTFRITMVDETMTACTTEDVTITVYDSLGVTADGYTGTVAISTSTLNGNWTGPVGLSDTPGDDNGVASYVFDGTEVGAAVTLTFEDFNFEDVNVNLLAGEIVEDGAFDPDLEVTGCLPSIVSSVCFDGPGGGTGSLALSASPGPGRMVIMWVFHAEDLTPQDVTSATFNGAAMTEIADEFGANTGIELWGITDALLPAGGASYPGAYTFDSAPAQTASMCLVELADVEQTFPTRVANPNENLGNVNSNSFGAVTDMTTSITTSGNNALVLSGVVSDYDAGGGNSWFNSVEPDPPMVMRFTGNNDQNPVDGTAGGSEGVKPVAGLITVIDHDNSSSIVSAAHIVAGFDPLVAGDPEADGYVPVLLQETLSGNISYRAIGHTLRTHSNAATSPDTNGECSFVPLGTGTTSDLAMPAGSTVERAYLYWAGSGTELQADLDIEFGHSLDLPTLNSITGEELFMITGVGSGGNLDYFASYKDVTTEVAANGNGTYTLRELDTQSTGVWSGGATACAGGWGLIVIYSNPAEAFRVANLFHGFQPFQNSSFTLVPRNFRMKTTDDDPLLFEPNGQITHITVEGDETLEGGAGGSEALGIQDGPGLETFTVLTNSYNPLTGDFNSTVTRPAYFLDNGVGGTNLYQFDATGGDDGAGYENDAVIPHHPDLIPYTPDDVRELGDSWGFDVDTHYITGNTSGTPLYPFAGAGAEAEQITTEYSSGQDLVLLIAEVISVTNFDLADLEVFKSVSGALKVDQPQDFVFTVTNNGNNGSSGGEATGLVVVADILPNGMTLNSVSGPVGSFWTCYTGADRFSCTYDILNDCVDFGTVSDDIGCETVANQLSTGESLPPLTANVQVGGFAFFPDESNPTKNIVRMQHNGANSPAQPACIALISGSPGVIPDPDLCQRSPQFDNVNDLDGGATDINDLTDKDIVNNNNVDSIIDNVIGLKTDLAIDKSIDGDLEVGETQTYTISVSNNGPDDTNETINIIDNAPAGIQFDGTAAGTGWVCSVNTAVQIDCDYAAVLGALDPPAVLTLPVTVTGTAGQSVTNTAQVTPGTHNFDTTNTANNTDSDTSIIIAPPVASQEKFLLSVSVGGNDSEIGGLVGIENDDYFVYNPQSNVGTGFYDDSASGDVDDANAVHVFKNGHIAISASGEINGGGTSTVGGLAFQPEDIVVYDPIKDTAIMLFDGSAIFDGPITANHNIDAVFVKEDGRIVFSIFGDALAGDDACITWTGPTTLCFNRGDVVEYNPLDGSATILVDAFDPLDGDDEIFTSEAQVNGIYLRVDDTDPNDVKEVYILSVNGTQQVGACAGCDPVVGTGVTPDDIIEVDLTGADPVTQNLFVGDVEFGVFTPVDGTREIDAIHVVEDGYHGHFSISQSQAGTTCSAGQITIRKHEFSHDVDTDYVGSILITTDDGVGGAGTWSIAVGNGALTDVGVDDGVATYTFDPTDNGEVTLYLTETDASTIDVNVTNLIVQEQEDPAFNFSNVIADITYEDEFTSAAFDNNDGITVWASPWTEVDNAVGGTGPATGNVIIAAGSMQFTTEPGLLSSEMSRIADLSLFPISNDLVELSFDFKYSSLNSPADRFVAEVRENNGANWEEVWVWDTGGTNGVFQGSGAIDLKAAIEAVPRVWAGWSSSTEIRFRVDTGYTGTSRMFIDNVKLQTGTTTCGIGVMDHWEIQIDNLTGTSAFEVGGISCLASQITISGHDANHVAAEPGEAVTFRALSQTLVEKGSWSAPSTGTGPFVDSGTATDGLATYTFPNGESQVILNFNYTDPTLDPENVNFDVTSAFPVHVDEDPTLRIGDVVLRIYNETQNGPNLIPTQISGKASSVAAPTADTLTVQVITSDLTDTTQCIPLIDVGETLTFSFGLECIDDDFCNSATLIAPVATVNGTEIPNLDSNGGTGAAAYADIDLTFASFTNSGVASEIQLMYQDAGNVQLHAQFDVPTNIRADTSPANIAADIGAGVGTPLETSSNIFTVRPFGLDIDFSGGRADLTPGQGGINDESYAADSNGTAFAVAGVGFSTTVRGIQYDAADDIIGPDGIPDPDSELWDNLSTPNFGHDSTAATYKVQLNSTTVAPPGGYGALADNDFLTFTNGASTQSVTFDEVGIIDLEATLLDLVNAPVNYLLSGTQLTGHVRDVGRFYPASFELSGGSITSRAQARMEAMCINPVSDFTYMGEEFEFSASIEAQNGAVPGVRTRNYVDGFAKLDNTDLLLANFFGFEELAGVDNDLSSRMAFGSTAPDVTWPTEAAAEPLRGIGLLAGNLIFNRQSGGVPPDDSEDGPYNGLSIGLNTADTDGAALELGIDLDEVMPIENDVALIATEDFRYGRLLIDNAFGPETEELGIPFRIEYWNTDQWATNTLDSCTVLFYNASEDDRTLRSAFYVDGSWEGNLDADADNQDDGETTIENDEVIADTDLVISISGGQTNQVSGVDLDADGEEDDKPLVTSAPGEGLEGSVIVEFDLNHASLPYSLDFLSYDWRTTVEVDVLDEIEDGNYIDNPRSQLNFGSYRGHDRVINWQEIYIGPTP